jgi:hypothetical protein
MLPYTQRFLSSHRRGPLLIDEIQKLGLGGLIGETFVGQVEQELATFKTVTGRVLLEAEATALRDVLNQSLQAIVAGVSLTHPNFKQVALELSKEGAAKLGIV